LLGEALVDFPFADAGSKAHALALLLQPFVRPVIQGPTRLYLLDTPTKGTGKGLLADIAAIVALGHPADAMSLVRDGDELEKRITSLLLAATPMVLLDNVKIRLESGHLCAVLTTTRWRGRRLGKSEIVECPNTATWLATGNNVEVSDEMARRTVLIRLDAEMERPEDRSVWRHPDLLGWATENRHNLVSACLSLVQRWVDEGMPAGKGTLGRFEGWGEVIGGILEAARVPGFLANRGSLYQVADTESLEWAALCEAWWEVFEVVPVTATDVLGVAKEHGLLLDIWGSRSDKSAQQRIGRALGQRRDRIFRSYRIRAAGSPRGRHTVSYCLEKMAPPQHGTISTNGPTQIQNAGSGGQNMAPNMAPPEGDMAPLSDRDGGDGAIGAMFNRDHQRLEF
jgi:hypothetical protein